MRISVIIAQATANQKTIGQEAYAVETQKKPNLTLTVLYFVLTSLLVVIVDSLSPQLLGPSGLLVFSTLLLVLPGLLAALGAAYGVHWQVISLAVGAGLSIALNTTATHELLPMLIYAPASLALTLLLRAKQPNLTAASITAALFALGSWGMFYLLSSRNGQSIAEYIQSRLAWLSEPFRQPLPGIDPGFMQQMLDFSTGIIDTLAMLYLTLVVFFAMLAGLFSLTVARWVSRAFGAELKSMTPFCRWQLPRNFSWGILILFGGGMLLWQLGFEGIEPSLSAIQTIILVPLLIQGASLAHYLLLRSGVPKAGGMALVVIASLLFSMVFFFGGAIEQAIRIRKRFDEQRK